MLPSVRSGIVHPHPSPKNMLYLALGSNLGNSYHQLCKALTLLEERLGPLCECSDFIPTAPVGFKSDNAFLNAAASFECTLPPLEVLRITQEIEREMGRQTKSHDGIYADRIIDIDLLLIDGVELHTPELTLPHPRMHKRRFVIEPLAEIAPDLPVPGTEMTVREILEQMNQCTVDVPRQACRSDWEAVCRLLPQLTRDATPPTYEEYESIVASSPHTLLHLLRDYEGTVCGMGTLCLCLMPTGKKAWIEDVVVDDFCRKRGYGHSIIEALIHTARREGAKSVNLTSRSSRKEANRLYSAMGFTMRYTNVYRTNIDGTPNETMEEQMMEPCDECS